MSVHPTREEFMSGCIPKEIKAGKPRDQAIAICASKFKDSSALHKKDEDEDGKKKGFVPFKKGDKKKKKA